MVAHGLARFTLTIYKMENLGTAPSTCQIQVSDLALQSKFSFKTFPKYKVVITLFGKVITLFKQSTVFIFSLEKVKITVRTRVLKTAEKQLYFYFNFLLII